eukprot:1141817-Ditylum_brightwellii.AAC.1
MWSVENGVDGGESHLMHVTGRRIELQDQNTSKMKRGMIMRSVENDVDSCESHLTHGTGRKIEFGDQNTSTTTER